MKKETFSNLYWQDFEYLFNKLDMHNIGTSLSDLSDKKKKTQLVGYTVKSFKNMNARQQQHVMRMEEFF